MMAWDTRERARAAMRADAAERCDHEGSILSGQVIKIELAYRLPPTCGNEQDTRRLRHEDLADLDDDELDLELGRVRMALLFGDVSRPVWARKWLLERQDRIRAERGQRTRERRRWREKAKATA